MHLFLLLVVGTGAAPHPDFCFAHLWCRSPSEYLTQYPVQVFTE